MVSFKRLMKDILLWPNVNVLCSQTLYESVFGCLELYAATGDSEWRRKATDVSDILAGRQNADGGFDIGFNFVFGKNTKKASQHDSTTPESLSGFALWRIDSICKSDRFAESNVKLVQWLVEHSYPITEEKWGVPYAPGNVDDVHITNSCSFALPILAAELNRNSSNNKVKGIVNGMINFLEGELESESLTASYWRYFYRGGEHFVDEPQKEKIDNYHMAQQLRYQCEVQLLYPTQASLRIINRVSDYLYSIRDANGLFQYCNDQKYQPRDVHVWGLSSVVPSFITSGRMLGKQEYIDAASQIVDWLIEYAWNGHYFYPVLDIRGEVLEREYYPRSNGWVFEALAFYYRYVDQDPRIYSICTDLYEKLESTGFTGRERNMWNPRLIAAVRVKNYLFGETATV
jgi:hypothetical protein